MADVVESPEQLEQLRTAELGESAAGATKKFKIKSLKVGKCDAFGTLRYFLAERGLETQGRRSARPGRLMSLAS